MIVRRLHDSDKIIQIFMRQAEVEWRRCSGLVVCQTTRNSRRKKRNIAIFEHSSRQKRINADKLD